MKMNRLHLIVGVLGLIAFVLQGQYMAHFLGELRNVDDGLRMLYRSAHIYLMLVSVLNITYGLYWKHNTSMWRKVESFVLLIAPLFMLLEFYLGATTVDVSRPYAYWSLVSIFGVFSISVIIHLKSHYSASNKQNK